jgi:hypothetical protein
VIVRRVTPADGATACRTTAFGFWDRDVTLLDMRLRGLDCRY